MKTTKHGGRDMLGFWADDGYDFMEKAGEEGWRPVASWGLDGWDLGSWPYVSVLFRELDGKFQRAYYVEGDITLDTYDAEEERTRDTDELAFFHWKAHDDEWVEGLAEADDLPDRLRGPFSWKRVAEADALARSKPREDGLEWNVDDKSFLELGLGVGDKVAYGREGTPCTVTEVEDPACKGDNPHNAAYRAVNDTSAELSWCGVQGKVAAFKRKEG